LKDVIPVIDKMSSKYSDNRKRGTAKNSAKVAHSWLKKMDFSVINEVNEQCGDDVYKAFGYKPMNYFEHTILKMNKGNHTYPVGCI
jgi:hypothetical protein